MTNLETSTMEDMKVLTLTEEVNAIAMRLARGVNRWNQSGSDLKTRVAKTISFELDSLSFENDITKCMFSKLVSNAFAANHKTSYEIVFPKYLMDANGNYTKDSLKWV